MLLTQHPFVSKVVSGGQTGVDRAALDVALAHGIPCGGWCPKGRKAEDGILDARYPLRDTPIDDYAQRTTWNVRDSDGTLILTRSALIPRQSSGPLGEESRGRSRGTGGTAQTVEDAKQLGKPHLGVDLNRPLPVEAVRGWIHTNRIRVLNVAGPRESKDPGIYAATSGFLRGLLRASSPHS